MVSQLDGSIAAFEVSQLNAIKGKAVKNAKTKAKIPQITGVNVLEMLVSVRFCYHSWWLVWVRTRLHPMEGCWK
jgi:hypothetical protein